MGWPILFGDIDDIIRIVLIFLFLVGPIIGQILKSSKKVEVKEKPRPRPRPAGPAAAPRRGPQAVHDEIDAFLRRAAERRGAAPVEEVEIVVPDAVEVAAKPRRVPPAPPLRDGVIEAERAMSLGVSEHVKQHIESSEIELRREHLAETVGHADEKMEGHLHRVFDHDVGRIPDSIVDLAPGDRKRESVDEGTDADVWNVEIPHPDSPKRSEGVPAEDIVAMLRDPATLKDAIILTEIFRRPGVD